MVYYIYTINDVQCKMIESRSRSEYDWWSAVCGVMESDEEDQKTMNELEGEGKFDKRSKMEHGKK